MTSYSSVFPLPGFKQKGGSAEWAGPCPWCGGDDRFWVNTISGRYACRRCGRNGDAIQFLMEREGLNFFQACERLDINPYDKLNRKFSREADTTIEKRAPVHPGGQWCSQANLFIERCSRLLTKDRIALEYVASRGLKIESLAPYQIGWNPEDCYLTRSDWGLPEKVNEQTGKARMLFISKGLVIPSFTGDDVTGIKVRRFPWREGDSMKKYLAVSGGHNAPWALLKSNAVVVVESELDALLMAQEAFPLVSVIALGTSSRTLPPELDKFLSDSSVILVALDNDATGQEKWAWWQERFKQAFCWPASQGKDVGEMFTSGTSIKEWVRAGLTKYRDEKLYRRVA